MITKWGVCAATFGVSVLLTSSAVAHANPATPMAVIDSSAADLCGAINANPTDDGVINGLTSLQDRGLDEVDGALVLITAMHHVCPQHESLLMGLTTSAAAEAICTNDTI